MANVFDIKTFAQILNNPRKQIVWIFTVLFSFAFAVECFGIDKQSPKTIITNPLKVVEKPDFTFHFSGEDAQTKKENLQYSWRFDQKEWTPFSKKTSAHIENLTNGLHLFEVRAKNEAGVIDATPDKVWFEVAKEPPETTIIDAPKFIKTPGVTFHFSVEYPTKKNNLQYSWRLDGGKWMPFSPKTSATLDNLTNGMHLFEVKAKDELGNIDATPDKIWFEVAIDKEPPETEIINPPKVVRTVEFIFKFKGSDNLTKLEDLEYSWRLDGGEWTLFSKETDATLHNLTNGIHWFEVKTRDDVGNVDATPARVSFEVSIDQPPDTELLNPPKVVTSSEVTFQLQGRDAETKPENLQYSWHLDDDDWSKASKEATVAVTNLTDGRHLFEARAHDDFGNVDQTPAEAWFEVAIPSPVIKITSLTQSPIQIPKITFSFEVEEIGDWLYSWQLDGRELAKHSKEQSTTLTNLTNGKHLFKVRAKNEANNIEATPAQVWFEVAVDLQPPDTWIIKPPTTPIKSSQVTFNFSGKDNRTNTKDLQYSWHLDKGEWSPFSKATSATLSNLTNGTYTFEVKAKDEAGIEDEYPTQATFVVAIDPLHPLVIISNPPDAPLRSDYVTFYFQVEGVDAQMRGNLEYSWRLDEGEWSIVRGTSIELKDLTNGKHLFEVQAEYKSGKVEPTPAKIWFEVDVDRLPPDTIITNRPDEPLRNTEFTFEFSGTDSHTKPDDLWYSWRLSRIPLQESEEQWSTFSKDSSAKLTKLLDSVYLFEVKARDESKNEDKSPAEVRFKVDVNAPETTIIDYPKEPLTEEVNITFLFSGTDLQTPEELEYSWRLDEGKWSVFSQNTSVQYSKLRELGNGKHWFEVRAKDKDGNIDPTPDRVKFEVNIPPSPPIYMTKKFWYSIAAIVSGIGILTILYFRFIAPIITVLRRFNPYHHLLVDDEKIYWGDEQIREITDRLYNGLNVLLKGERGTGKTTLLKKLKNQLGEPLIPIYIDMGNIKEEQFFGKVMEEIIENPHISRDESELQIKSDEAEYDDGKFRRDLKNIISQLQNHYNKKAALVLLLDEMDVMINYKDVPEAIRKLLTAFKRKLMIVGSGQHVEQIDEENKASPLTNIFLLSRVPPLSNENARNLIKEPVEQYIDYSEEAVEDIITYSGSIPRHILMLCGYIVEEISLKRKIIAILTKKKVKVDSEKVQQVFESKMLRESVFQQAWNILKENGLIDNNGEFITPFQEWIRSEHHGKSIYPNTYRAKIR